MKNFLLVTFLALCSVSTLAQKFHPNKFKDFFSNNVVVISDKAFGRDLSSLKNGEAMKVLVACDDLYHFVSKQADSITYEILAIKNSDEFECKKSIGKKLTFLRRFYFYNGGQVEDFGYSLENPDMDVYAFLCKAFAYCP